MGGEQFCLAAKMVVGLILNVMVVKATGENHLHTHALNVTTSNVTKTMASDDVNANIINDDMNWQRELSPTPLELTSLTTSEQSYETSRGASKPVSPVLPTASSKSKDRKFTSTLSKAGDKSTASSETAAKIHPAFTPSSLSTSASFSSALTSSLMTSPVSSTAQKESPASATAGYVPANVMTTSSESEKPMVKEMTSVEESTEGSTSLTSADVTGAAEVTKKSVKEAAMTTEQIMTSAAQKNTEHTTVAQKPSDFSGQTVKISSSTEKTTTSVVAETLSTKAVTVTHKTIPALSETHTPSTKTDGGSSFKTSTFISQPETTARHQSTNDVPSVLKTMTSSSVTSDLTSAVMTSAEGRVTSTTEKTTNATGKPGKKVDSSTNGGDEKLTTEETVTATSVSVKLTTAAEQTETSTAIFSTTDCFEALKVDHLTASPGQNNVTLTWEPLNSTPRVGAIYYVKVKGQKEDDTCLVYTVGGGSELSPNGDRKHESCPSVSQRLIPVNHSVAIPALKVCTTYDVTVTSECGACPCDVDTSAMITFTTLSPVPGRVESIRLDLNESDSSKVGVTWTPPSAYPSCRVQRYVLQILHDGACVGQVLFLDKEAAEQKDEDEMQGGDTISCEDPVTTYGSLTSPKAVFTNLLPDTVYTLNVTAGNAGGMGLPASRPVHTLVAVPSSPTQFSVIAVTSDSVRLKWRPPLPRPGPTVYSVQLLDMGSPYHHPPTLRGNASRHCGSGYYNSSCRVDNLRPYWTYNFTLTAHTARGDSVPAVLTSLVTTQSAAPGLVDKLKVERADDIFTTVYVTWHCPALKHRNTRIVGFLLQSLIPSVESGTNETADVKSVSTTDCDVRHSMEFHVIPERQYFFQVLTLGDKFNATQWTAVSYLAPPGRSEAVSSLSVLEVGGTNLTLQWTRPMMTNGQLTGYGVKVMVKDARCIRWTYVPLEKSGSGQSVNPRQQTINPERDCNTRTTASKMTLAPGNQAMTLTLSDLPPDTSLTLVVYPKNGAGWGFPTNVSVRTLETVPTALRHISVNATNATTLVVTWQPPQPRPGATTYHLVLHRATRLDSSGLTFLSATAVNVTGWSSHKAVLTDLWSGWRYSLKFTTFTSKGSRTVQLSPIQMPQSQPGRVQNMSVLAVTNDYRHVTVTWDYPPLTDRHGVIVNFTTCCRRHGSNRYRCQTIQQPCQSKSPQFCATFEVKPGHNYTLTVYANNEYRGMTTEHSYLTKIGPPPDFEAPVTSSVSLGNSQSTFRVTYCAPCLLNDSNGEITLIALLVCHDPYCQQVNTAALSSRRYVENLPSWKMAKGNNFHSVYRPTEDAWISAVKALADSGARRVANSSRGGVYTVGEEEDCESRDSNVHCNGPLPSGQAFRVLCVSCTSASCTASAFSSSILTASAASAPGVGTLTIVGSGLGVALGLIVVVIILCYQRRRRRHGPKSGVRGDPEGEELADMTHTHRTVTIQDYGDILREWKSALHEDSGLPSTLVEQFAEIRETCAHHSKSAAVMEENTIKNRYTNILPFDHSRVKLAQLDDDVTSDYINANYIPGYHSKREYIATQGPLEGTVDDFWRMVWEQRCPVIVMLSALTEGRLNKVYKYFPDEHQLNEPVSYGMVTVTLLEVHPREDYLVRTFRLNVGRGQREVKQFFVDSWKDFKANLTPSLVLEFVRAVREEVPPDNKHPLLVHCSAGVGRTGTWIAIDYFMHYIRNSPPSAPLNIRAFVLAMRDNRAHMVQSLEQYVFLHEVVAELTRRKTEVDRYDEPVYCNQPVYANLAYEQESDDPPSSSLSLSSGSKNSNISNNGNYSDNENSPPPPSSPSDGKGTPTRPPRSRISVISAVTSRM